MPDFELKQLIQQGKIQDPYARVFSSGEDHKSPMRKFADSRADNQGAPAAFKSNHTGYLCPLCEGDVAIMTTPRGYVCISGKKDHQWQDLQELRDLNPRMVKIKQPIARQDGYREVRLAMPNNLVEALTGKFGDRLAQTLSGVLELLSQERFVFVGLADLQAIESLVPEPAKSSQAIKGIIYRLTQDLKAANERITAMTTQLESVRGGGKVESGIFLNLDPDLLEAISAVAQNRSENVKELCERTIKAWAENGWL